MPVCEHCIANERACWFSSIWTIHSMVMNDRLKDFVSLQDCDNLWWDAFTTEFFEDDAMLTITFCLEDGPKRYSKK